MKPRVSDRAGCSANMICVLWLRASFNARTCARIWFRRPPLGAAIRLMPAADHGWSRIDPTLAESTAKPALPFRPAAGSPHVAQTPTCGADGGSSGERLIALTRRG